VAQNGQKQSKERKYELSLSYDWQRDLVEFCARYEMAILFFKTAGFNRSRTSPLVIAAFFGTPTWQ
jgi:hypothetical protein